MADSRERPHVVNKRRRKELRKPALLTSSAPADDRTLSLSWTARPQGPRFATVAWPHPI